MPTTSLTITGMSCGSCRHHVDAALRTVPGVTQVQIDLAAGTARIDHDGGMMPDRLIQAVESAGYGVQVTGPTP